MQRLLDFFRDLGEQYWGWQVQRLCQLILLVLAGSNVCGRAGVAGRVVEAHSDTQLCVCGALSLMCCLKAWLRYDILCTCADGERQEGTRLQGRAERELLAAPASAPPTCCPAQSSVSS